MSQKGLAPILIIVIITALTLGGYFIHKNQYKSSSPVQTNQSTANETNSWKTYVSDELGFSIQYPEDLYTLKAQKLTTQGENYGKSFISLEPNDIFNSKKPLAVTYAVSIAAVPNSSDYSLTAPKRFFGNGPLISYIPEMLGDTPINETTLGGMKAYRVKGCCGGQAGIEADIQTIKDGKIYQIVVAPRQISGDQETNKEIYERIISSFKF